MSRLSRGNPQPRSSRRQRTVKKKVLIVCEGNTEKAYFDKYRIKYRQSGIQVIAVSGDHTDAVGIVNDAIEKMNEDGNPIDFDEGDSVWCVFDSDRNTPAQLAKAKTLADKNGINIIFSNPCFEVWLLLHLEYTSSPFNSADEVITRLKLHPQMNNYQKGCYNFDLLESEQDIAIERAEQLIKEHENQDIKQYSKNSKPSTNAHELVSFLKNL